MRACVRVTFIEDQLSWHLSLYLDLLSADLPLQHWYIYTMCESSIYMDLCVSLCLSLCLIVCRPTS